MNIPRHKVFISFHSGDNDYDPQFGQYWKNRFEKLFVERYESIVSRSVQDGDIEDDLAVETTRRKIRDEFIADATVTVVLVGPETWKRKFVDWEISSSITNTKNNPRCGLLGILLPGFPGYNEATRTYNPRQIPPRLYDNIKCDFASLHVWNENPDVVAGWIHNAFERRYDITPDNSRDLYRNNRSADQTGWQ